MIAAAQPSISIGSRQQRIDFRPGEEAYERTRLSLVGNHKHSLNQSRVLRRLECGIAKKGTDRSQAQIATPGTVRTAAFQVIQERSQEWRGQVLQGQLRGRFG